MQLDAFLRSAKEHAPYASITILAQASDELHRESYEDAWASGNTMCEWRWQTPFATWVADWWNDRCPARIVFHTDDEVFYRQPPAELFDNEDDVIMLRQGRNTTYCHPLDCEQAVPHHFPRWKWSEAEHDFGYPLSLNACIYKSEWIRPLLNFPFTNPTRLEAGLANQWQALVPQYAVAPEHSCTVALPHNVVSVDSGCPRGGNPEWQPDALCEKYLDGWRINLDAMDFSNINAAHVEVPLEFYKP